LIAYGQRQITARQDAWNCVEDGYEHCLWLNIEGFFMIGGLHI